MKCIELMENDIIVYRQDGKKKFERILHIDVLMDQVVLVDLDKPGFSSLRSESWSKIKQMVQNGEAEVSEEDPYDRSRELDVAGEKIKKLKERAEKKIDKSGIDYEINEVERIRQQRIRERDKRYNVIQMIASPDKEPGCYFEDRVMLIKEAEECYQVPYKTIARWVERFWKGGKRLDALLDNFTSMGTGKKVNKKNKLGRKSNVELVTGKKTGVNLTDEVRRQFDLSIKLNYTKDEKITLTDSYNWMLNKFYKDKIKRNSKGELEEGQYPSLEMYYKWHRETELNKQLKEKIGNKRYDKDFRALRADAMLEALGPGHIVEIDATIADIWLRDSINPSQVVGRPIVYIAKDVFSREIVGLHVCLEGPSYVGAMSLLYNMQASKVDYCRRYGIDISPEEWPVEGMPQIIKVDRGELISPMLKTAIQRLGVIVDNTPSYRGDAKGIVERTFRTLNDKIIKFLPSHIKKDYRERGARRYELDAELDIVSFTRVMILTVLELNSSVIEGYVRTDEMIADDISAHPNDIWVWGQKFVMRQKRVKSDEVIDAFMRCPKSASITERGMLVDGLYYTTDMPGFNDLQAQARREGRVASNIRIDHRNTDKIYWMDNKYNRIIPLYLNENYQVGRVAKGHTWEEIEMHLWTEKVTKTIQKETERSKGQEFQDKVKEEVDTKKKANGGVKVKVKNVKEARRDNAILLAHEQAIPTQQERVVEINLEEMQRQIDTTEKESIVIEKYEAEEKQESLSLGGLLRKIRREKKKNEG